MTARSNQPSRKGNCSARPSFSPTEAGTLRSATRSISGSGSTPHTFPATESASALLSRPVPQPQSSTRRPRRSPSRTTISKISRQLSSSGRTRSYADARRPKSGVAVKPRRLVGRYLGVRHRFDRMLRLLEGGLVDEDLQRCVLDRARMMLDGRLERGDDAGGLEDRLELLGLGDVLGERNLHFVAHDPGSSPTCTVASTRAPPSRR